MLLFALVVLVLVSSVLSQETGYEERLQNDLFCVEWDIKSLISQSVLNAAELRLLSFWLFVGVA